MPGIDPVSLALMGVGTAAGIAQGIGDYGGLAKQSKYNNAELDKLLALQKKGALGLSGQEEQQMYNQSVSPIQSTAAQLRARTEQVGAAMGGNGSGADLARLRSEEARTVGGAQQQAGQQINAAQAARVLQQRNEIEQREAQKAALNRDKMNAIFGGVSQLAGAAGAAAGSAPGTFTSSGAFGGAVPGGTGSKTLPGLGQDETQQLATYYAAHPDQLSPELALLLEPYMPKPGGA